MKNLLAFTVVCMLFLVSCGNKSSKSEKETPEIPIEKSMELGDVKKAKNCDEFLDNYEKWINNYLKTMEKYMKNPLDQSLMQDYSKLAQEGMTWYNNWNIMDCASKEKYEKRFEAIANKVDKKMEELGLD